MNTITANIAKCLGHISLKSFAFAGQVVLAGWDGRLAAVEMTVEAPVVALP